MEEGKSHLDIRIHPIKAIFSKWLPWELAFANVKPQRLSPS
jgi:hypothetical protein